MKRILRFYFLIIAIVFCSCYQEEKETPTKGNLVITVDETVVPSIKVVVDKFDSLYSEANIQVKVASARESIADLLNERTKLIISSRGLNSEERDVIKKFNLDVQAHTIAFDAVVLISNNKNSLKQIDLIQLKKIFTGEIDNWKLLNKNFKPGYIQIFGENQNGGCYEFLKYNVLNGGQFVKTVFPCSTSTQVIDMVANTPGSIGWVGSSWEPKDDRVRILEVAFHDSSSIVQNFYDPHPAHIYRKYYPLTRPIYLFSLNAGMNVAGGLVSFITHQEGQRIINKTGLVPATQPVRLVQPN